MIDLNKIYQGNALTVLKDLPEKSINCVMTSPPYWGLRDYSGEEMIWPDGWVGQLGLEPDFNLYIDHLCFIFDEVNRVLRPDGSCWVNIGDSYSGATPGGSMVFGNPEFNKNRPSREQTKLPPRKRVIAEKNLCLIPSRFAIAMQDHGWIVRQVIIWQKPNAMPESMKDRFTEDFEYLFFFVKSKRYFFEQQFEPYSEAGLDRIQYATNKFRGDINNPLGMLGKGEKGGSDQILIEPNPLGRNKRCVWSIPTKPFSEAHFAVFPEDLVDIPLKAGCPEFVCSKCGKPRSKIFGKKEYIGEDKPASKKYKDSNVNSPGGRNHYTIEKLKNPPNRYDIHVYLTKNKGEFTNKQIDEYFNAKDSASHWFCHPDSKHGFSYVPSDNWAGLKLLLGLDDTYDKSMTESVKVFVDDSGGSIDFLGYSDCGCGAKFEKGIVLDPFFGAGTTGVVAVKQRKNYIGIDLNKDYIDIAENRIGKIKKEVNDAIIIEKSRLSI